MANLRLSELKQTNKQKTQAAHSGRAINANVPIQFPSPPCNFRHWSISVISVKWKQYIIRASILNLISIGE